MNIFENGSAWLKADFHLHTIQDKEFEKKGFHKSESDNIYKDEDENAFHKLYVSKLVDNGIQLGVITNHNKFVKEEYQALRKEANKNNIWLLPGVELSVNDGANGIHCLIVFDKETWLNTEDYIHQFLTSAFEGIPNRENENARCKYNLNQLFEKLEEHQNNGRDSFVVLAHVSQNSGFFEELDGGRIQEMANKELFKRFVLGLQKVRYPEDEKKKNELNVKLNFLNPQPALLEGSDCKSINKVGDAGDCFVKVGHDNFKALKYALMNSQYRVTKKMVNNFKPCISSISIQGKSINKTINLSKDLNCFIGIRGSGKSSVIEILRYALGIDTQEDSVADKKYKDNLVNTFLGDGGKVSLKVKGLDGKNYLIERFNGQASYVSDTDGDKLECSISSIIGTPIYFGQKDLTNKNEKFNNSLLLKLVNNDNIKEFDKKIEAKKTEIQSLVESISSYENIKSLYDETEQKVKDKTHLLKDFEERGIVEKIKQITDFQRDKKSLLNLNNAIGEIWSDLNNVLLKINNITNLPESNVVKDIFISANKEVETIKINSNAISLYKEQISTSQNIFEGLIKELNDKELEKQDEFAQIKRDLNQDNIQADSYLTIKNELEKLNSELDDLNNKLLIIEKDKTKLKQSLEDLEHFWHEKYDLMSKTTQDINNSNQDLKIDINYKGDKKAFLEKIESICKGTGTTKTTYQKIVDKFTDFIDIMSHQKDLEELINYSKTNNAITSKFDENLFDILTYKVEDKIEIKYKDKALEDNSLGQKASALIVFLLVYNKNNILIIDQPEDDLDNQTLYDDVIKKILCKKNIMQFIFVTHNANIPVLGDSEEVFACKYDKAQKIEIEQGSIDDPKIQKQIVKIMEGGDDAFKKRKDIYKLWKLQK